MVVHFLQKKIFLLLRICSYSKKVHDQFASSRLKSYRLRTHRHFQLQSQRRLKLQTQRLQRQIQFFLRLQLQIRLSNTIPNCKLNVRPQQKTSGPHSETSDLHPEPVANQIQNHFQSQQKSNTVFNYNDKYNHKLKHLSNHKSNQRQIHFFQLLRLQIQHLQQTFDGISNYYDTFSGYSVSNDKSNTISKHKPNTVS